MNILLVHNSYQIRGGEDDVFNSEWKLLAEAGHLVATYTRDNEEIKSYGLLQRATLPLRTVWAWDSAKEMRRHIADARPDLVHFHNTFPLVSPSAYSACHESGVPVVQTLHNPRLMCPAASLYRDGHVCEECVGKKTSWPGVLHGCYRDSRIQTGMVAAMLAIHRQAGTWEQLVDKYIASTHFFASKFAKAGLPADKIYVKPHFVTRDHQKVDCAREYALFVGRLAPEKGVTTLLKAWQLTRSIPLKVRGDGPLSTVVQGQANDPSLRIEWLPRLKTEELIRLFQGARFLVWPSEGLYETFGLVAVQAFACGVPVIASKNGAMGEIVSYGRTGLHFASGDSQDLATKVEWAWAHPREMEAMGSAAREEYENKYTPERNYKMLMNIYRSAIEGRGRSARTLDFKGATVTS
jgi:glycosyltransferase involved in cell wall biosynthesis